MATRLADEVRMQGRPTGRTCASGDPQVAVPLDAVYRTTTVTKREWDELFLTAKVSEARRRQQAVHDEWADEWAARRGGKR